MSVTTSTQLAQSKTFTTDGVVTTTLVDRVSPERIALMLFRASAAARYGGLDDDTQRISPEIRSLLVNPKAEDG